VALHKELRPLLHSGVTVRADDPGEGTVLHGVVGSGDAVFAYVRLSTSGDVVPPRLTLPGLDPAHRYRVAVRAEIGLPDAFTAQPPWTSSGVTLSGAALAHIGLAAPLLHPGQAALLHLTPNPVTAVHPVDHGQKVVS
jgi:alpha-galactosidase